MEILQDERKIYEQDGFIIFELNNKQKFTKKHAVTLYLGWKKEIDQREKQIADFKEKKNELKEKMDERFSQQIEQIHKTFPKISMVDLKHWKDVQVALSIEQQQAQLKQFEDDIKALKQTVETWSLCESLPAPEESADVN